jgi:hypothetical protein
VPRQLTSGELLVLSEIQSYWGDQNAATDVFFSDRDEAVLFVRTRDGTKRFAVVLTNLAEWYETGTISLEEMRDQIRGT